MTHSDAKFGERKKEREREKKKDDDCPRNLYGEFWIEPSARVRFALYLIYLIYYQQQ